jgi:acetyltransferase-like isoleucine patch superfamily enzyme
MVTFRYIRGTILSLKFKRKAFVLVSGRLKIHQANGGSIDVGNFVSFSPDVKLVVEGYLMKHRPVLSIGAMTHIGDRTEIHSGEKIVIGKHVRIGWDCLIMDRDYHAPPGEEEERTAPIIIEDNVWIGARAIILKGVTIGHDAVVGAGSVVTKNVEPCTMVAGNPARVVKKGLKTQSFPAMPINDYLH